MVDGVKRKISIYIKYCIVVYHTHTKFRIVSLKGCLDYDVVFLVRDSASLPLFLAFAALMMFLLMFSNP